MSTNLISSINPVLSHRLMVTLSPAEPNFIALQTYTPNRGKSQRFLMDKAAILSMLNGKSYSFTDADLNNFVQLRFDGAVMHCKAIWLSVNARDNASGYVQRFAIATSALHKVLSGGVAVFIAHTDEPLPKARLSFTADAHTAIRRYIANKHTRRALSKFFRDNLNYGSDELLKVYSDAFADGFYICSPVTGFNGGIILHKGAVRYYGFPKVEFSLHT